MAEHLIFDLDKLRERAEEVNPIDAKRVSNALKAKLKKYPDIICLCGPQIGVNERVICIRFNDDVIKTFINPMITKAEGLHLVREKDISIPEKEFISPRPNKIIVRYQTEDAIPEENILEGPVAEVFDRMQKYLDGVTPEDFGLEVIEGFDEATEEEREQVISMYLESLKTRAKILNDNINEDKDAKELMDAIKFMEAVDEGKVTLVDRKSVGL
jgi:peptide deformylase